MDPGQELLQHLKTVPNLVNEDPSTITPTNTAFVDIPWSDFSKMLAEKRKIDAQEKCKEPQDLTPTDKGSGQDFSLDNWDASTGYQDVEHKKS